MATSTEGWKGEMRDPHALWNQLFDKLPSKLKQLSYTSYQLLSVTKSDTNEISHLVFPCSILKEKLWEDSRSEPRWKRIPCTAPSRGMELPSHCLRWLYFYKTAFFRQTRFVPVPPPHPCVAQAQQRGGTCSLSVGGLGRRDDRRHGSAKTGLGDVLQTHVALLSDAER